MKTAKKRKLWLIPLGIILVLAILAIAGYFIGTARHKGKVKSYINSDDVRVIQDVDQQGVGDVSVSTLKVPEGIYVTRASYSFSGQVILSYQKEAGDSTVSGIAIMKDDGSDFRSIYSGTPGSRLLPFKDNRRILLGDTVLECPEGTTLDNCPENSAQIYEIVFPEKFTDDKKVVKTWSEVIISPDNEHFAWTMLRSDCGAAVALGKLVKDESGAKPVYRVEDSQLISRMNIYQEDAEREGYLIASSVIGGEVKQFVHGGTAISLVGADQSGDAQSVVQELATGEYTMVTTTPGYDETTIFSPDEKLGITMTTRFSETTSLPVLGLVPRPYGDVYQNITSALYMYSVTGVRSEREGNIGPALINIQRSMSDSEYMGINLSNPDSNWVYCSPMSWNDTGSKAMWMERQREGGGIHVQIATLLDYEPSEIVPVQEMTKIGNYADADSDVGNVQGKIAGKESGYVEVLSRSNILAVKTVEFIYHDYSDDGIHYYNGYEKSKGSVMTSTTYEADLSVTDENGKELGNMDAELHFSAAYRLSSAFTGSTSPQLDVEKSHATATWGEKTLTMDGVIE